MAGGRPLKLDASTQQIICAAIRRGLGYEPAAQMAGISYSTLRNWINRAEAEVDRLQKPRTREKASEAPFLEFLDQLQRAEAEGENTNADIVNEAAAGGRTITKTERYQKRIWDKKTQTFVVVEETETTKAETAAPDWRAAAFILERRHSDRWGRQLKSEISGPGGKPVPIQIIAIEAVAPDEASGDNDRDGNSQ
jgi:transposase